MVSVPIAWIDIPLRQLGGERCHGSGLVAGCSSSSGRKPFARSELVDQGGGGGRVGGGVSSWHSLVRCVREDGCVCDCRLIVVKSVCPSGCDCGNGCADKYRGVVCSVPQA